MAENQRVEAGEVLFRVDPVPFDVDLRRAEARLAQVTADIKALKLGYQEKREELGLAETNLAYAEQDYRRQSELARRKVVPAARLDDARHALDVARRNFAVVRQGLARILAGLGGDASIPPERHPDYLAAAADRDRAALDLAHTAVVAPLAGIVANRPELGRYVKVGTPVVSIVADRGMWIEANFKETDLTRVKPGQPARVTVDTYPGRAWRGRVESISQATGAEFSVLPAQNATGNWVKVVQRIPVRIAIEADAGAPPLRAGMSAVVEIDTGHRRTLAGLGRAALAWARGLAGGASPGSESDG